MAAGVMATTRRRTRPKGVRPGPVVDVRVPVRYVGDVERLASFNGEHPEAMFQRWVLERLNAEPPVTTLTGVWLGGGRWDGVQSIEVSRPDGPVHRAVVTRYEYRIGDQ